jgi:hypothetical protein
VQWSRAAWPSHAPHTIWNVCETCRLPKEGVIELVCSSVQGRVVRWRLKEFSAISDLKIMVMDGETVQWTVKQ